MRAGIVANDITRAEKVSHPFAAAVLQHNLKGFKVGVDISKNGEEALLHGRTFPYLRKAEANCRSSTVVILKLGRRLS